MEYGCIGEKLPHSFSKIIHNEICDYRYELKELKKTELDEFMKIADFKAINVTIPYKEAVIPYLHSISDRARAIGAVNTIVNKNGKLYGYNTDFLGLTALLEKENIELKAKKVLILGSGGTSKTAFAVAESQNASEIIRVSRTGSSNSVTYSEAAEKYFDAEIIINTTPVGMYPNIGSSSIDIKLFPNLEAVVDAVYNPLSSALVTEARERKLKACGGLFMLVAQAVYAAEKFTGKEFKKTEINRVYNKILKDKCNIVLIGMPGCGKTTIGNEVAKRLNKTFIDTDKEIEKETGISILEIFQTQGETEFRKKEAEIIKKVSVMQSSVIATGGGVVLNNDNILLLKENGIIIFLDRPIEDIVTTSDRPLSSNRELLERRYNERYNIYKKSAMITVNAVKDIEKNINAITEVLNSENFNY